MIAVVTDTEERESEKEAIEESAWGRSPRTSCVLAAIGESQCDLILSRILFLRLTGAWGNVVKIILIQ